jgi:hypothetical protein
MRPNQEAPVEAPVASSQPAPWVEVRHLAGWFATRELFVYSTKKTYAKSRGVRTSSRRKGLTRGLKVADSWGRSVQDAVPLQVLRASASPFVWYVGQPHHHSGRERHRPHRRT